MNFDNQLREINNRLAEILEYVESADDLDEQTQAEYFRLIEELNEVLTH